MNPIFIIVPALFAISATGLAYVILKAFFSGAEVYSETYSSDTARAFEDVFLFIPPKRVAEIAWASAAVAFAGVFLLTGSFTSFTGMIMGLIFGAAAGSIVFHAPGYMLKVLKARRIKKFNVQLVDSLINMSNALKAGFSITQAFESVVKDGNNPIAQEFNVFLQQTRVGLSFSDALQNLEERVGSDDFSLVAMAIETARKTGGNITEVFERIAATIRERFRIEGRIRTLTAQGRMQGIIVGSMPIVLLFLLTTLRPGLMQPFIHSFFGSLVMGGVGILILFGALLIRKIVNIDV